MNHPVRNFPDLSAMIAVALCALYPPMSSAAPTETARSLVAEFESQDYFAAGEGALIGLTKRVQTFLTTHPAEAASKDHSELVRRQEKLLRFIQVKNRLLKCKRDALAAGDANKRDLYDRAIRGALGADLRDVPDCSGDRKALDTLGNSLTARIAKLGKAVDAYSNGKYPFPLRDPGVKGFALSLVEESKAQATLNLLILEKKYGDKFSPVVAGLCCKKGACSDRSRGAVENVARRFQAELSAKIPRVTDGAQAPYDFRNQVERVNGVLKTVAAGMRWQKGKPACDFGAMDWVNASVIQVSNAVTGAVGLKKEARCDANATRAYNAYMDEYMRLFTDPKFGMLAATEHVREAVGPPLTITDVWLAKDAGSGVAQMKERDLDRIPDLFLGDRKTNTPSAYGAAKETMTAYCDSLDKYEKQIDAKPAPGLGSGMPVTGPQASLAPALNYLNPGAEEAVMSLLKTPMAVGAALLNHPEMSGAACSYISKLDLRDAVEENVNLIVSVGSLVTAGVGGAAGWGAKAALRGSRPLVAALLNRSTVAALQVGLAAGVSDAMLQTGAAIERTDEKTLLERALVAGLGDGKNSVEVSQLAVQITTGWRGVGMAAFGAVGDAVAISVARSLKVSKAGELNRVARTAAVGPTLTDAERMKRVADRLIEANRALASVPDREFAAFLKGLKEQQYEKALGTLSAMPDFPFDVLANALKSKDPAKVKAAQELFRKIAEGTDAC